MAPAETNTGLKFVVKGNVGHVHRAADPFRGISTTKQVYDQASRGAIST